MITDLVALDNGLVRGGQEHLDGPVRWKRRGEGKQEVVSYTRYKFLVERNHLVRGVGWYRFGDGGPYRKEGAALSGIFVPVRRHPPELHKLRFAWPIGVAVQECRRLGHDDACCCSASGGGRCKSP